MNVVNHYADRRQWLLDRFSAMTTEMVTTWDIAQDIAANWTEGRKVSELPECKGKQPGEVFREWVEAAGGLPIDKPEKQNRPKYPGEVFREWLGGVGVNAGHSQAIASPSVDHVATSTDPSTDW